MFSSFSAPRLNAAGQVAFLGSLAWPDINFRNGRGIWATDANGDLQQIVRLGDAFDVSNDPNAPDLRTPAILGFVGGTGNQDGRASAFNDSGRIAFEVFFTDGSEGVFVADTLGTVAALAGDYDDSGQVEQGDLNLVLSNWGQARPFDANGDPFATTIVDQEELNRVLNNWDTSAAPSFAEFDLPEPTGLAALAGLALCGMRFRG